ncbi:hypothetical protein [Roseomonas elaeocarpi]|uniref:Aminoglycoside phosphotransferase domain-containing protein n=1 Tax=Roseomonas elaeocarpi TaxID=907779 RepID=A0ABV6JMF6_9PROT
MMHSDQLPIDIAVARRLIHEQFPQFRDEKITPVAVAGTVNALFCIGPGHAARFPLRAMEPAECARLLRSEAQSAAGPGRRAEIGV